MRALFRLQFCVQPQRCDRGRVPWGADRGGKAMWGSFPGVMESREVAKASLTPHHSEESAPRGGGFADGNWSLSQTSSLQGGLCWGNGKPRRSGVRGQRSGWGREGKVWCLAFGDLRAGAGGQDRPNGPRVGTGVRGGGRHCGSPSPARAARGSGLFCPQRPIAARSPMFFFQLRARCFQAFMNGRWKKGSDLISCLSPLPLSLSPFLPSPRFLPPTPGFETPLQAPGPCESSAGLC